MNVSEVLNELGIPFVESGTHKSVRHNFLGIPECPYCGHGDYYAAFPRNGGPLSCWSCGSHSWIGALFRLSCAPKARILDLAGSYSEAHRPPERPTGSYLPTTTNGPDFLGNVHKIYLKERGIDVQQAIDIWKVESIGFLGSRYKWSIFLPVYFEGQPKSWTTRKIGNVSGRYYSAPPDRELLPIKSLLYGHDLVRGTAIVCEGPMDALRIGPGAVSTFGAQFSPKQVAKLAKIPRRIICFDSAGDVTGERMGQRLADALAPHDGETILVELDAKDAAEASDREIKRLRRLYLD